MSASLSASAPIVDANGRPKRELIAYLQGIGSGVQECTTYTFEALSAITPTAGFRAFCTDSSVTTFATVLAGGGSNTVPVYGDGTNWRVG